jgi:hypothetical protein
LDRAKKKNGEEATGKKPNGKRLKKAAREGDFNRKGLIRKRRNALIKRRVAQGSAETLARRIRVLASISSADSADCFSK